MRSPAAMHEIVTDGVVRPRAISQKLMQTFRIPRALVHFLKEEAGRGNRDLTAHVVRWLEGMRAYFGLPEAASALLEADRRKLKMERYEYLQHVLFQRGLALREKGAGHDAPSDQADPDSDRSGETT